MSTKRFIQFILAICVVALPLTQATAQTPPPRVMLLVREEIKTGKMPDHERESNRFAQVLAKANSPYHRIGMSPVAGNENEVMYIWGFDSFATLEKSQIDIEQWATGRYKAEFDAIAPPGGEDYHVSQRDMIAVLRDDLSYNAPVKIGEMRYMSVSTLRVRPGQYAAFQEAARMYQDAMKKGRVEDNYAIYQVVSGAPDGIFLVFSPMKSLAELDDYPARQKAFMTAMGDDIKKLDKLAAEALNPGDNAIYRFNPRMSYVSREFAAAAPGFWNPPPVTETPAPTNRRAAVRRGARQ